jgi:hypothetical protein
MKMPIVHQIFRVFKIALLLAATLQSACASGGNYLEPQEEKLG